MASSIMPVPTIWLSAPSKSHGQNAGVGHGTASPVAAITTAKNTSENGKPNRKRMLVAPQVPSGPVNCRCIALRATCPSAAVTVKGIQSVAMLIMEDSVSGPGLARHREGRSPRGQPSGLHATPTTSSSLPSRNDDELSYPLRHHHVIHVHVGGEAPAVGEGTV